MLADMILAVTRSSGSNFQLFAFLVNLKTWAKFAKHDKNGLFAIGCKD